MMTATLAPDPAVALPARRWLALPVGLVLGLALGVLARLWMRLIADDPAFSWAGTMFIVAAFGLFGAGQGASWAARRSGWRRRAVSVTRVGAAVLSLPLFTGAGAIMLPTVLAASLACWRTDWPRWTRVLAGVLALPVVLVVVNGIADEFGWGVQTFAGVVTFLAIYTVVVVALRPTVAPLPDGWHLRRKGRVLLFAGAAVAAVFLAAALVGA
jgi:hypothetical protein